MIIPSIDLEGGRTVQLVEGEQLAIDAGSPQPILERFARVGEVAVIDLDAAKGVSNNEALILDLCKRARIRVGGGIRDYETACKWLDAGAAKIIVGTSAEPELLSRLPKDRVQVALDSRDGEIVTHGWRKRSGRSVTSRIEELKDLCGGFLLTFVEREGKLGGTDLEQAARFVDAAGSTRVTIAGGVTTADEVATLDRLGADAQVGMALYNGQLPLDAAFMAPLVSDRADGLWPTVVCSERGTALGLAYSSPASLGEALRSGRGVYQSRRRGLWIKGESSGNSQELLAVDVDCDRDTLRFTVRQKGAGFCHQGTSSCWSEDRGLERLERRLSALLGSQDLESNSVRLARSPSLLSSKLVEEAQELGEAVTVSQVCHEAADLIYFAMVKASQADISMADIEAELDRRALKVSRRPCEAKPTRTQS